MKKVYACADIAFVRVMGVTGVPFSSAYCSRTVFSFRRLLYPFVAPYLIVFGCALISILITSVCLTVDKLQGKREERIENVAVHVDRWLCAHLDDTLQVSHSATQEEESEISMPAH